MYSLLQLETVLTEGKRPYHFDVSYFKRYNVMLLCSMVKNNFTSGNTIEVGVGEGHTSCYLRNYFDEKFTHYMFDSYEGLSEPTTEDLVGNPHAKQGNMKCSLEKVSSFMDSNCDNKNVKYVKGWVNDTIPQQLPDNICFAHIDVDLYEPMYHSMKHIIPKMQNNGIILIDDYEDPVWVGCKTACDLIEKEFNVKFTRINLPSSNFYQGVLQVVKQ